ncbi:unnamed protein product, partial [Adineta steineri]
PDVKTDQSAKRIPQCPNIKCAEPECENPTPNFSTFNGNECRACSSCIFIYFYRHRKKISIHHHLTLILVIFCFMDMIFNYPMAMFQNRRRRVILETPSFCAWWNWWAYSSTTALVWIAACGSIERHLLIFHNGIMAQRKGRF